MSLTLMGGASKLALRSNRSLHACITWSTNSWGVKGEGEGENDREKGRERVKRGGGGGGGGKGRG